MFRAVPGRVAGRGGVPGAAPGARGQGGSGRGVKGRALGQSPRGRVTIGALVLPQVQPAAAGLASQRGGCRGCGRRAKAARPPPPHYFQAYSSTSSGPFVSGDSGQRRGQWVVCSKLGEGHGERRPEKRQQLRGRSRALLIQAVEGAVILC